MYAVTLSEKTFDVLFKMVIQVLNLFFTMKNVLKIRFF